MNSGQFLHSTSKIFVICVVRHLTWCRLPRYAFAIWKHLNAKIRSSLSSHHLVYTCPKYSPTETSWPSRKGSWWTEALGPNEMETVNSSMTSTQEEVLSFDVLHMCAILSVEAMFLPPASWRPRLQACGVRYSPSWTDRMPTKGIFGPSNRVQTMLSGCNLSSNGIPHRFVDQSMRPLSHTSKAN